MENMSKELKFDNNGLIPAVVQDYKSGEVLMVAYMNQEALDKSLETGKANYWSRERQKLWLKGETSGHFQYIKSIKVDCDNDCLLLKVEQVEAACHTGNYSCFFRELEGSTSTAIDSIGNTPQVLQDLYDLIMDRTKNPVEGSYTNYLFEKGLDKILKKVGEEATEVVIAAKNKSREEIRYETADLIYHLLVLMVERDIKLEEIYEELLGRKKK